MDTLYGQLRMIFVTVASEVHDDRCLPATEMYKQR